MIIMEERPALPPPASRPKEIHVQLSRFILEQRADDFGWPLTSGEDERRRAIECRILLVRAGLSFQRHLGLAIDDAAEFRLESLRRRDC